MNQRIKTITKTIRALLANQEVLSLTGNVSLSLFGLINFMMIARLLDKQQFGEYTLYIATASLVEMFRYGFTHSSLIKFLPGTTGYEKENLIGSNFALGLALALFFSITLFLIGLAFPLAIKHAGYAVFFAWFPVMNIISFPFNNSFTLLQAHADFKRILMLRLFNGTGFLIFLSFVTISSFSVSLEHIILVQLILMLLGSIFVTLKKWDGVRYIKLTSRSTIRKLFNFGKYSTLSFLGTNLLRSADTYLISFSSLGITAVATYAIPMKLNELLQIPLRSFSSTLYPALSKAINTGNIAQFRYQIYSRTGFLTILFLPLVIFGFFFSELFVLILAGRDYLVMDPAIGVTASTLFKIFILYGVLLPVDRFTGIALDALNKPHLNSAKIGIMLVANIIGDVLALWYFKSLLLVAIASIIFMLAGSLMGLYLLNKEVTLNYRFFIRFGWKTFFEKVTNIINTLKKVLKG